MDRSDSARDSNHTISNSLFNQQNMKKITITEKGLETDAMYPGEILTLLIAGMTQFMNDQLPVDTHETIINLLKVELTKIKNEQI